MGFGTKTDYEFGRTFDLDATYEAIIKPAAEENNLRCIRADEIMHSGIIDTSMYEMLLRAELVIADISTGNVNAVYELGVRHALRPYSTIIMKESAGKLHFDLNHINTFHYEHLGKDIGHREATRARRELGGLISKVIAAKTPDSPVYTYLPKLQQPRLSDEEYAELLNVAEAMQERFLELFRAGDTAMRDDRFVDAVKVFAELKEVKASDPFVVQQLALATYKSKEPSALEALLKANEIISELTPEQSNDPETLGIHGAINKRLWELTQNIVQLDVAVRSYGRGFEVRRDYYNGENFALCLDLRAQQQSDLAEAEYDRMSARKVRLAVYEITKGIMDTETFAERSDRRWVLASSASMAFALGLNKEGEAHEKAFLEGSPSPAKWEVDTYNKGKLSMLEALGRKQQSPRPQRSKKLPHGARGKAAGKG